MLCDSRLIIGDAADREAHGSVESNAPDGINLPMLLSHRHLIFTWMQVSKCLKSRNKDQAVPKHATDKTRTCRNLSTIEAIITYEIIISING